MRDSENTSTTRAPKPSTSTRPKEEIPRLGKEIYQQEVRPQVEADHLGEVVAIDVESGSWAIDVEALEAVEHL